MASFTPVPDNPAINWKRIVPNDLQGLISRNKKILFFPTWRILILLSAVRSYLFILLKNILPQSGFLWRKKISGRSVVALLAVSVIFIISILTFTGRSQDKAQLDKVLTEVMHDYDEGVALIDLNPVRARALLKKAQELLEARAGQYPLRKEEKEFAAMHKKIDASLAVAARRYEVVLESYFELSLIKPQGAGDEMALYQDALVVLDRKSRLVYRLLLSSKSARILSGDQKLADAKSIAVHGENVFVLADDVDQVTMPSGQLVQILPVDTEWGKIVEVASYAGNIYLLDAQKNQIWKYIRTETGFSLRQDYLLLDTLIDLSYAKNLAIDGYVWLIKGHEIIRFVQGQLYPWKLIGLDDDLGISLRLYTDDTTKNIYILDTDNRRVIIADKDGEYLSQYVWAEDIPVSDMVVSEVAKKILLLSGGTIYGIELK